MEFCKIALIINTHRFLLESISFVKYLLPVLESFVYLIDFVQTTQWNKAQPPSSINVVDLILSMSPNIVNELGSLD